MRTTYKKIKSFKPCFEGWKTLLENTNPEMDMTKEIDLMDILKSNGIKDAVWALRCWDYMDWCLFICEVAESVLPIFEEKYPEDDRPRKALQAIRDYKAGIITKQDLENAAAAAYATAAAAHDAYAASAAASAATASTADDAMAAAAYAANAAAAAAYDANAAYDTTAAAYASAASAAYASAARQNQWEKTEQIFIKHFGGTK